MNMPPPEITDPLLKSLSEDALDLPRMAALEAQKARRVREHTRGKAARRPFHPLAGLVWLMRFRAVQAAVALLILAAMIEGGSLITGERSPFAPSRKGVDLLSAATVTTKTGQQATVAATNVYWSAAQQTGDTWDTFASGNNNTNWVSAQAGGADTTGKASGTAPMTAFDKVVASNEDVDVEGFSTMKTWQPTQYLRNSRLHFTDVNLNGANPRSGSDFVSSSVAPLIGHPYAAEDTALGSPDTNFTFAGATVNSPVIDHSLGTGNIGKIQYAGGNTLSSNVALGSNQTWGLNAAPSSPLTVSGAISGSHGLAVSGTGKLALNGGSLGAEGDWDNGLGWNSQTSQGQVVPIVGSGATSAARSQDVRELGRIDSIKQSESKIGGPIASHPWQTQLSRPATPFTPPNVAKASPPSGESSVIVNDDSTYAELSTSLGIAQPATPAPVDARKLIRNAALDFEVASFEGALDTVGKVAGEEQGYILTQNSEKGANGKLQGQIIVKVLPANLDRFLLKLRALGEMKNQTVAGQDVTKD